MNFGSDILHWYYQHKRDLPWRGTKDPYKIWLSEIILQLCRVEQGLAYYERFIRKYPTVKKLAAAHEDEVLKPCPPQEKPVAEHRGHAPN